jgi:branched-chain amino acid transport system substrate-binding protein
MKNLFCLLFLLLTLLFTSSLFAEKETVKIGVLLPLSGDYAWLGEDIQRGFKLAQKESKPNNFNYELIFEDDGFVPAKAVLAVNKLIKINKVDVVFCLWSNVANTIVPITEKEKKPLFAIMWDEALAEKSKYVFTHETTATEYSTATAKLVNHFGWKKVAFIETKAAGWSTGTKVLLNELKKLNIEVITHERVNAGERDFRGIIQKLVKNQPDGIIMFHQIPDSEIFLRQIKDQGIKIPITGFFEDLKNTKYIEGLPFVCLAKSTPEFAARFEAFSGKPLQLRGAHAYDVYNLIVKTYEDSKKTTKLTPDEFSKELKEIKDYPGAVGILNVDERGVINSPASFKVIKNGKIEEYKF